MTNPAASSVVLGDAVAVRLALALGVMPSSNQEPFTYSTTLRFDDAAAIGSTLTSQIQISADSDFVCTHIRVVARGDDSGRVLVIDDQDGTAEIGGMPDPGVLIQITESGQNRVLHDRPVDAFAAYGFDGGKLQRPKLFRASNSIGVELTLLKQAAAGLGFDVVVCFVGFKDYSKPGSRR